MRQRFFIGLNPIIIIVFICVSPGAAQQETASSSDNIEVLEGQEEDEGVIEDPVADLFTGRCAGCHSFGTSRETGPDLEPVADWPEPDIRRAVERMQTKAGPLTPDQVEALVDFNQDADAAERVEAARRRFQERFTATLRPASPARGASLFSGRQPLENGGMACAACHQVQGRGGSLAASLDGIGKRMGKTALISGIQQSGFDVMRAAYRNHPVTSQESLDLAEFLMQSEAGEPGNRAASIPVLVGITGATLVFLSLPFIYRNRNRGIRARLVRQALKR